MKALVSEIFYSIQGEGIHQGLPTTFIRLQGCNLLPHCSWCDTAYAQGSNGGTPWDIQDILDECVKLEGRTYKHWVCITGGEPLMQLEALHELVKGLSRYGFLIEVETNGSYKKPYWWTLVDSWVADIKCPSSGVCGVSLEDEWFNTRVFDQVKLVVGNREDINYAGKVIMRNAARNPIVLVSPVNPMKVTGLIDGGEPLSIPNALWMQEVVEFCKELKVRFSLQIHKVVWGNRRGV